MFSISSEGRKLIRGIEKFAATFYYDSKGVSTVGFGHAIVVNGAQVNKNTLGAAKADEMSKQYMLKKWGKTIITEAEADALFAEDMVEFENAVNAVCDSKTYQCEYDAMVSFAFNCGAAGFGRSSVAKYHKAGARKVGDISMSGLCAYSKTKPLPDPANIQQGFVSWSKSGGVWLLGLYRRRLAELMVYGGRKADEATQLAWSFHD